MTEMFGEAWSPMSVPDLAPDDDDDEYMHCRPTLFFEPRRAFRKAFLPLATEFYASP